MGFIFEALTAVFLGLLLSVVIAIPLAWIAMLLIGALHSLVPMIPAFGFFQTYLIVLIVRVITAG